MNRQHQSFAGMNDLLEDLLGSNGMRIFGNTGLTTQKAKEQQVPVNIFENEEGYLIDIIAPGISKEEIQVKIEENVLTISHEAASPSEDEDPKFKTLKSEYTLNSFKRSFKISNKVEVDKVSAKYENGILKLNLPKKEVVLANNKTIAVE